ncbi:MAG: hypothetical protein ABI960_06385 [Candidatus Eisenbacteria bacterium]
MARPLARPTVAVAAARPESRKLWMVMVSLFALAAALAAFALVRDAAPRHAAADAAPSALASSDRSSVSWNLVVPTAHREVRQATNRPAPTKAATRSEPDWSALSLGVTEAQAAVLVPRTGGEDGSPAELTVAMSHAERGRLIAAARESESGPAPSGYRPLLGALVPPGGGDGICR